MALPHNYRTIAAYYAASAVLVVAYLWVSLQGETLTILSAISGAITLSVTSMALLAYFKRPSWKADTSIISNQQRQIDFDITLFIGVATLVAVFELYILQLSAALVARTFIAILSVGTYCALAIALELEYGCIKENITVNITRMTQIVPGKVKLRRFLSMVLAAGLANLSLTIFGFVQRVPEVTSSNHHLWLHGLQEVALLATVILGVSIYLLYLYVRNLFYVLNLQVSVLRKVEQGCFDLTVPVVSEDESGLLSSYHNLMIERMRDRERLYRTLKKSVGTNIMTKLLNTDEEKLKQGESHNVAILFCDLRGFSSLGESASAEEIILFLNIYFAEVSAVISQNDGIINKFMGDAVLAIFGLESKDNAAMQAVRAGLEIIEHSATICMPNDSRPETGVGIHFGQVAAGTIGSEERYEYTVVGDAVNKASRLESLSKRLDYSLILSKDAYDRLDADTQSKFVDLGAHYVRGMTEPLHVYGAWEKIDALPPTEAYSRLD